MLSKRLTMRKLSKSEIVAISISSLITFILGFIAGIIWQ